MRKSLLIATAMAALSISSAVQAQERGIPAGENGPNQGGPSKSMSEPRGGADDKMMARRSDRMTPSQGENGGVDRMQERRQSATPTREKGDKQDEKKVPPGEKRGNSEGMDRRDEGRQRAT